VIGGLSCIDLCHISMSARDVNGIETRVTKNNVICRLIISLISIMFISNLYCIVRLCCAIVNILNWIVTVYHS